MGLNGVFQIVAIAVFAFAIWRAIRARPLGQFRYRWGTWMAFYTGLVGVGFLVAPLVRPAWLFHPAWSALGPPALYGSVGLFLRMRIGAVLAIGTELAIIAINPAAVVPLLSLVIVNACYFGKRWNVLHAGAIRRRPFESESEPVAPEDEMVV